MEDLFIQRNERVFIRLGVKILCAIVLLIGLGWGGREAFLRLQEYRMMKQARLASEKHDDRWAAIAARRVFDLNPKNSEACRLMARNSGTPGRFFGGGLADAGGEASAGFAR